jgi:hypothetical protein
VFQGEDSPHVCFVGIRYCCKRHKRRWVVHVLKSVMVEVMLCGVFLMSSDVFPRVCCLSHNNFLMRCVQAPMCCP